MSTTHELIADRIRAVLFGQAIGDALGVGAEFMSRSQVAACYPNGLRRYADIVQDEHRERWPVGAFTDDTDQMLCILESLLERDVVDEADIARRIAAWAEGGGMGIGRTVQRAIDRRDFLTEPWRASEQVWAASKGRLAANGAVMRTSVAALWDLGSETLTALNAARIARITHFDPRCIASCVVLCEAIRHLVTRPDPNPPPEGELDAMMVEIARRAAVFDPRVYEVLPTAIKGDLRALKLDEGLNPNERNRIGYTLKAFGAALWALRHAESFEQGLLAVIHEGGDADSNGAIAGAMLGARFGVEAIPQVWIDELHEGEAYAARVEAFCHRVLARLG